MITRRNTLGFDRRIDLDWLDATAARVATGAMPPEVRGYLWKHLEGAVAGDVRNSARGKTVTVLSHIWSDVPHDAESLRQRCAALLDEASADERLGLHWAMMVGTYPIFTDVAAAVGRLLTLEGTFTLARLTRRLVGTWGERSTLERAAQRIVRSMVQWGVLQDTDTRGMYQRGARRFAVGASIGLVLVEAVLVDADEDVLAVEQVLAHPANFPFLLNIGVDHLRESQQFRLHRQGLDTDIIELRR